MNKSDLEKIVAIAREGSMAKAAQKLYITQPALSKCLTKVEASLGETLFTRRPNGLSLTYAGECLVKRAEQIMKLYDDVEIEFCELNHMRKGILKLGSAKRIGTLVLPNLLKRFKELYPNIKIDIIEEDSMILEEQVLSGVLDIAILCLPLKNTNISYRVFYEEPLYAAIPEHHPLNAFACHKSGEEMPYLPLNALKGAEFTLTKPFKKTRLAADRILACLNGDYSIGLESQNIETVIHLVANGLGISLIPHIYSKVYKTENTICYYQLEDYLTPTWQWAVIYDKSIENLTRPSRELYHILCKEGCLLPGHSEKTNEPKNCST